MSASLHELRHLEEQATGASTRRSDVALAPALRAFLLGLTLAALLAALFGLLSVSGTVRLYLLVVVSLAGVVVVTQALAPFGRLQRRPRGRERAVARARTPPFLERAQRRLEVATTTAAQWEWLRRDLGEIAEQRLAGHGLRLASAEARGLLGEEAWLLLAHPAPGDKLGPGPAPEELERLLAALERI